MHLLLVSMQSMLLMLSSKTLWVSLSFCELATKLYIWDHSREIHTCVK